MSELEPKPTLKADEIEALVRKLALARRRGEREAVNSMLNQLKEEAADSPFAWEAQGDEYIERKYFTRAQEAYKKAHELEPSNASLERKYAEAVLLASGGQPWDTVGESLSGFENYTSGKIAMTLSFMLPGLGQIALGAVRKGAALMTAYIVGWFFILLIPNGLQGLLGLIGLSKVPFNSMVLLPLGMVSVAWMWALADAASQMKVHKRIEIEHPKPPVDKDFEI
ncbi:MAG: hypothetical protein JST40_13875 [Armatimonadetes bacterium]|nr:hypothetical protein [Armatimonadota bacterium]